MAEKKPIEQSLIARLVGSVIGAKPATNTEWFGPGEPIAPTVPAPQQESVTGRAFDYPVSSNMQTRPRNTESVTFPQMRALADGCDILRLVIETRKDQLEAMKWSIGPSDEKQQPDKRCEEVRNFFKLPDGENNWSTWLRMLLEEMFVTDALTIYPWMKNNNTPYRFELVDGATIKRVIDGRGRTPAPPQTAYQQILKGVPAVNYTANELLYAPRNKRIHKIYGYSPVEQIIMTVNIALRRSLYQLQYYTDGSAPDLLFQCPADWQMAQIKEFQQWWNDSLSGNSANRAKAQFVPNGVTPVNTKDQILKDSFDEWLARIVCYALSVSAQPFIKENNRATAETAHDMAMQEGLYPIMLWVKGVLDTLIWKYFGYTDLEFKWDDKEATDPLIQAQIDDINLKNGTNSVNEVRTKRGDTPVDGGDTPMILTATGYVPLLAPEPAPTPEATVKDPNTPPEQEAQTEEQPDETKPSEKVTKSVKYKPVAPINRFTQNRIENQVRLQMGLEKLFAEQAQMIASNVVSSLAKDELGVDAFGKDWDNWQQFNDLFGNHIATATGIGVNDAYAQIDLDNNDAFSVANENGVLYANERAAELVGMQYNTSGELVVNPNPAYSINETTRTMLRTQIENAMAQGLSNEELASIIVDSFAFSKARALNIARTETALADCTGNMLLYRESGVVHSKQWLTGSNCCAECAKLDNEIVELDGVFSNGDSVPPAHPSCRCDFVPLVEEEDNE